MKITTNIRKYLTVSNLLVTHVYISFYFNAVFFFLVLFNLPIEHYFLTQSQSGKKVYVYVTGWPAWLFQDTDGNWWLHCKLSCISSLVTVDVMQNGPALNCFLNTSWSSSNPTLQLRKTTSTRNMACFCRIVNIKW